MMNKPYQDEHLQGCFVSLKFINTEIDWWGDTEQSADIHAGITQGLEKGPAFASYGEYEISICFKE